jgi:HD-like signal output (HDOD) protein
VTSEALRTALGEVVARGDFQVPPYPAVALRLQRVLAKPGYGLAEVADTISADPALAARVLGIANSAMYRSPEEITSLARAVNRLGVRSVSSLALAAGLGDTATQAGALFDVKYRVWRRSVTCALACQKLAPLRRLDDSEAFLVGLLHGFGRSVAVAALEKLLTTTRGTTPLKMHEWLAVAEEQRGGLALAVAERWQLPANIIAGLRPESASTPMGVLVAEAERIAGLLEMGSRPEPAAPSDAQALGDLIQGLPAALEALAAVPAATPGRAAPNAVASVEHALPGPFRPYQLEVVDLKKRGRAAIASINLAATGMEFASDRAFQEGAMARLAIGSDAERIDVWFNVLLNVPHASGCRVEVQLFSPPRELKERWLAMYQRAV